MNTVVRRVDRAMKRVAAAAVAVLGFCGLPAAVAGNIAQVPLFLGISAPPLVLLTMGRDHRLYYEAYNDASDLDGDGGLDTRYDPAINYYGYFDSHKCYQYGSGMFSPTTVTADKRCSGQSDWSGDFLNYLTTSRMDALRKVLYGGYRSTDSTTATVLERVYIPQDAHSWGKEYTSVAVDGYDIRDYTPLDLPFSATRHLFASTSLISNTANPLLRVLTHSSYRAWEWVSIENPVAGTECAIGNNVRSNCAKAGNTNWEIVPSSYFSNLTQTTYSTSGYNSYPGNTAAFNSLVATYGTSARFLGSGPAAKINASGNPFSSQQDDYMTIFQGDFVIPTGESGVYTFAVDGDDAVDLIIDGTLVASYYGAHGKCDCTTHSGSITLAAGSHALVFRHQENDGGDNYYLYWQRTIPASTMSDYTVRVKVCVTGLLESDCKAYKSGGATIYKPIGLLQEHGETDSMMFGLLTGSYTKNTSGGVLRKNVLSFTNEVNSGTGQFVSGAGGIIETINKLKTVGFANVGSSGDPYNQYNSNCGVPEVNGPLTEGRCRMWGNPIGEMTYEGLRYFAGKTSATSDFSSGVSNSGTDDQVLGLPQPNWLNPYTANVGTKYPTGYPICSRPSQLVISDINPNYDTDKMPGSYFNSYSGDLTGLNVSTLADTIWSRENESNNVFIGQSGSTYDGAPTPKSVSSFKDIRGLTPEEPTREGGFYAASAALFGKTHDLNNVSGDQKTDTFSVVLDTHLPRITIPVDGKTIELVAFGKTVGGCGSFSRNKGSYQPTNTIVDFYVDAIKNTNSANQDATVNGGRAYGKFHINFEDSEYGSDHDMDAIVEYTFTVNADKSVKIDLNSNYAAGSCIQHMGYVISGTTRDGTYLEVRDSDTSSDVDYFLDTPPGQNPGGTWSDSKSLPLTATRTFFAGTTAASYIKHDPLWYASKWGGFFDRKDPSTNQGNNQLDGDEWDLDGNGVPDSYFLVINATKLKEQMSKAFNEIKSRVGSSSSIATNSTRLDTGTFIYQAKFDSSDWSGQLLAFSINSDGTIHDSDNNGIFDDRDAIWDAGEHIPTEAARKIFSYNPLASGTKGIAFTWSSLNSSQKTALVSEDLVNYLRGDRSKEEDAGPFRRRAKLLGDIVNSDPVFVGAENFAYGSLSPEGGAYASFLTSKGTRRKMVYVGANDGMLHGFATADGGEIFAYVPNAIISSTLATLASEPYTHRYFVDGSARMGDAYLNNDWRTVLVGTTGAGGRGVFALDVTDPDAFGTSKVLWEFTDSNDADLGYTLPQASIARMYDGHWVAIVPNGYNSPNGKAVLYILNLADGSVIKKIDTGAAGNSVVAKNGLSTPIALDVPRDLNNDGVVDDPDRIVDYIYAGDLAGNLWKFDVTNQAPSSWGIAGGGTSPLFVACAASTTPCTDADRQSITGKPQAGAAAGAGQDGGVMVYFGTGKYFEDGDNSIPADPQIQTFYGIWDKNTGNAANDRVSGRINLQNQTITAETTKGGFDLRVTSANPVYYQDTVVNNTTVTAKRGWYLDLKTSAGTKQGERVVSYPLLRNGRIVFVTLIPSSNPCEYGGTSWLMELDASSGKRLDNAPWDIYGTGGAPDGAFNSQDMLTVSGATYAPSGKRSTIGIVKTPGVISGGDLEYKYTSGSSGGLEMTRESAGGAGGRQTWVQLR